MGAQGDEKQCSRRNEEAEDDNAMENLETIQDFVAQQAVKQYNDGEQNILTKPLRTELRNS